MVQHITMGLACEAATCADLICGSDQFDHLEMRLLILSGTIRISRKKPKGDALAVARTEVSGCVYTKARMGSATENRPF